MKDKQKAILITIVFAVIAFILGPILWPLSPEMVVLPSQIPYFIVLSILEALLFGFGIAHVILNWKKVAKEGTFRKLHFASVTWLLVSWWPHDNFHKSNGLDIWGLLGIEYGFHLTLIIAGVIIALDYFQKR